ncbi:B3 domain-containing protein [Melia azedarach]|nr:B3 domain-containing protein [Melia azedarach]
MTSALGGSSGKGVENAQFRDQQFPTASKHIAIESQGDEFWPLSGKPYFTMILAKSHVQPLYQLTLPAKMTAILPSLEIPAFLTYKGKEWQMVYHGEVCKGKRFDTNWKKFAIDNKLKVGDGCVFELIECSSEKIKFKVQILRGDIPCKFEDKTNGESENMPIIIE